MPERASGFEHKDAADKDDAALRREAREHLAASPSAQLVAELLTRLRALKVTWWSAEGLRKLWPASVRMRWYRQRADLRQQITTSLTGLAPKAARKKDPDFQAGLIDSVLDDGDIDVEKFELAFDAADMAVYGPPGELWRQFHERMPWHEEDQLHLDLVAWLLRALLAEKSSIDGIARKAILSAWDVRTSIDGTLWHTRMPLEVRVEIDEARLRLEKSKPGEPFHAKDDLSVAVPELIAAKIPLENLGDVFRAAERALGFERPRGGPPEATTLPSGDARIKSSPLGDSSGAVTRPKAGEARDQRTGARAAEPVTVERAADPASLAQGRRSDPPKGAPGVYEAPTPAGGVPAVIEPAPRTFPSSPPSGARPGSQTPAPPPSVRPLGRAPGDPSWPAGPTRPSASAPPPAASKSVPAPSASVVRLQPGAHAERPSAPAPSASSTDESSPVVTVEEASVEDLEQTNPWIVPTDEEIWIDAEPPADKPEGPDGGRDGAPTGKRRRSK